MKTCVLTHENLCTAVMVQVNHMKYLKIDYWLKSAFQLIIIKPKPKGLQRPIRADKNITGSQWDLEFRTSYWFLSKDYMLFLFWLVKEMTHFSRPITRQIRTEYLRPRENCHINIPDILHTGSRQVWLVVQVLRLFARGWSRSKNL